jgi:hypothetical protein
MDIYKSTERGEKQPFQSRKSVARKSTRSLITEVNSQTLFLVFQELIYEHAFKNGNNYIFTILDQKFYFKFNLSNVE